MAKKKITLSESEWRLVLYAMNRLRNDLIAENKYTDVVDDVINKIIKAPIKKVNAA